MAPSPTRILTTVPPNWLATQTLVPSKAIASGPSPTANETVWEVVAVAADRSVLVGVAVCALPSRARNTRVATMSKLLTGRFVFITVLLSHPAGRRLVRSLANPQTRPTRRSSLREPCPDRPPTVAAVRFRIGPSRCAASYPHPVSGPG